LSKRTTPVVIKPKVEDRRRGALGVRELAARSKMAAAFEGLPMELKAALVR
jgi:hypothetical protein